MTNNKMISRVENERFLVLERVYNMPRNELFQLFKEPEHLKRWWSTDGWEVTVCNVDFRPGGVWHYCMVCVDKNQEEYGMESWNKTIYKEIIEPEKIVYIDYFSDSEGNINESMPSPVVTLEFIDLGNQTKLISRSEFNSVESLQVVLDMGVLEGINQTWNKLNELVEKMNQGK
ncbi:SRPBCC domain-containing protein [Aeribacillus pallidus]|uniref:ATPase n=1 Tax=Aeribacillus pallidus TaxID=33936 RepID=A0A165WVE0_9BACI|nr:SRPBCC domain-containing protein [Aeribacillus pallidus]KZN95373.1 ATPase [Aeribacillus pallidus]